MWKAIKFLLIAGFILSVLGVLAAGGGALYALHYFSRGLPDFRQLANYEPPIATRLHAGDGRLLAEYAVEKRVFVPIEAIPRRVIDAFLAAEDKNFYIHPGVDFLGVVRAAVTNFRNMGTGRRPEGASTITQQVAKNFLLSNEVSYERKIREMILAFRIERTFSKDRILELYLNEIYLGIGSYGVAAAALNYFNKSLDELTIAEAAYLAALPKAPNNYHPIRRPGAARVRRDYVLDRMLRDGYIAHGEALEAKLQPIEMLNRENTEFVVADFFAEEVRRALLDRYGEDELYEGGLSVRTTVDPRLQDIADRALRAGMIGYDRRHGWRGPVGRIDLGQDWFERLAEVPSPPGLGNWRKAVVLKATKREFKIGFEDGSGGTIPWEEMRWARHPNARDQKIGGAVGSASQIAKAGDVIVVEAVGKNKDGEAYEAGVYALRQIPDVNGGLVAIDPHTGRVLAMSGGWSFEQSVFNRVTQAQRQPGSAFKPFVYLSALESGYTPSTLLLDAPFVYCPPPELGQPCWKPDNYSKAFYGPSPMRKGIEKSRNLMTVRLAQTIGMDIVAQYAERFNVVDELPPYLPVALGAAETTLLRMTTAYAMLANGGKRVTPTLIDRIQDRHGRTIFRHDMRTCRGCRIGYEGQPMPVLEDIRDQVVSEATAYQIVSMLEGVVKRGTGVRAKRLGRPLGGKTGTTNDFFDAWFIGFAPDLVVGSYLGFDRPRTLGAKEAGSRVALPMFIDFMEQAFADEPPKPFRIPSGIRLVKVNPDTGELARSGAGGSILEAYKPGTEPVPGPGGLRMLAEPERGAFNSTQPQGDSIFAPAWPAQQGADGYRQQDEAYRTGRPAVAPATGTGGLY